VKNEVVQKIVDLHVNPTCKVVARLGAGLRNQIAEHRRAKPIKHFVEYKEPDEEAKLREQSRREK
jgi:hypothetical protein